MIRLFLENHEVELNESVIFTLNQQFEDITDPTKIYVEWSKTIKLPVTAANNKLFGSIYCPDRLITTTEGIGIHFDPYKKLDMRLEWGNAVLMQGYAKMLSFNNGYEISLNGELGKVFLEMKNIGFNAEGKYKLADPYNYRINKDLVVSTWKENDLPIGFAPLNVRGSEIDQTVFQVDDLSTKTFAEVLEESGFTEDTLATPESVIKDGMMPREIGEYRSYLQQPYIRFKELFKVFLNKAESLTGYEFELDPTWFNENNPYWDKLIYMLKRFDIENTQIKTNQYTFSGYGFRALFWKGSRDPDGKYTDVKSDYFAPNGKQESVAIYNSEVFSLPSNAGNITFNGNIQFTLNTGNQFANNNALLIIIGVEPSLGITKGYKYLVQRSGNYSVEGALNIITTTNSFTLPINLATSRREAGPTCKLYISAYWVTNNTPVTNVQPSTMISFSVDGYMGVNLYYNYFRSDAPFGLKDLWDEEYNMFDEILKYCKIHRIGIILEGKKIKFIPFTNYFLNYKIVDWTHKLDKSKDYIIKPITFENKYVKFNYEDNDTKLNEQYKSKHQYNYGEYNLRTQYEFNTETKDLFKGVKTSICNTDNVLSWENLYTNHKIVYSFPAERYVYSKDDDLKYVSCFGQYYFLNGYVNWDTEERLYMRSVGVSDDTLYQRSTDNFCYSQGTNILKCTTYPNIDIQYGSDICLFNKPSETYSYNTYTGNGIYYNFWEQYLNERYNIQNKIVTCYLKLNPIDYITFRFNQFIVIENQLYFVNKIYDYNADSLEPTKVDLITIQDIDGYTRNNYRLFQIYNWYGGLWDSEVDYVLLTYHTEEEKTIYLYSDTDVTWRDKDETLQDLYINGQNGSGTISAGSNVPITFKMRNNVEAFGKIIFTNGLTEIEVDVRLAQNLIFGLYNANGDAWDSANESIDLSYSTPRKTLYLTSESAVTWSDTSDALQNLYIYEDEDPGNALSGQGTIHSGDMIPVTFEMDVNGHETGSTGSIVFKNGVKSIKVDVTLSDDRSMTVYRWDGTVWDSENDYIRLERAGTSKTIYVTSNTPVTLYDPDQTLRSLTVNDQEISQAVITIPVGTKVPVEFTMLGNYDESGTIVLSNGNTNVNVKVQLIEQDVFTVYRKDHTGQYVEWDSVNDYFEFRDVDEEYTLYVTADKPITWEDSESSLQEVFVNGVNGSGSIAAGNLVPIKFTISDLRESEGYITITDNETEVEVFVRIYADKTFKVYKSDGTLWTSSDKIDLDNDGPLTQTIYVTSPNTSVKWEMVGDGIQGLGVCVNGDTSDWGDYEFGSGYIPAGTRVPVTFRMKQEGDVQALLGNVKLSTSQQTTNLDVRLIYWEIFKVFRWDGTLWDEQNDYIRLTNEEPSKIIYLTANSDVEWSDESGELQSLGIYTGEDPDDYYDYDYGSGVIPKPSNMKPIYFRLNPEAWETGSEGKIILFNGRHEWKISVVLVSP